MKRLIELVRSHPGYGELVRSAGKSRSISVRGLRGSALSVVAAALKDDLKRTILIITSSTEKAQWLLDDLETFSVDPLLEFPAADIFDDRGGEEMHLRTAALGALGRGGSPVAVASVQAALQPVPGPEVLASSVLTIRVGDRMQRDSLAGTLVDAGFDSASMVDRSGDFSVRGGIVDVYPFAADSPVRIEFDGDTVESIRTFDPYTQESFDRLDIAAISTARPGIQSLAVITDHLPDNAIVILEEPVVLQQAAQQYIRSVGERGGFSFRVLLDSCRRLTRMDIAEIGEEGDSIELRCHAAPAVAPEIERMTAELEETVRQYKKCFVMCDTSSEVARLKELFKSTAGSLGGVRLEAGRLQQGFVLPEVGLCVLTSHEMFNRYRRPRGLLEHKEASAVDVFAGIEDNGYVVHMTHGIGRFEGLKILESVDGTSEFLVIKYADDSKIYVPASQMVLVQKYVGGRKRPKLSRLRGRGWENRKEAARAAATSLAGRLLGTQAARMTLKRKRYPPDDDWQREFAASFRFSETPDQTRSIEDVRRDMCGSAPMDRLVCGDVGYGKTEIAMRAAFRAATAGRQVAILAPTTILVQQHYRTFRERMAAYPVNIGALSRFRTESEQNAIIESLAEGTTDIVIGTHRLLQKDILFKNLGLVIIDEEQRFGVDQKEFLKRFRSTVDVLTLTATPIPRTLHMSLLGLRDISALKTAPQERLTVETKIIDFNDKIIREGILRELNRNGQVYFIHNRVYNIDILADRIARIVPEARIAIGHGQMPPRELEATMASFLNGEVDVLVSTTIVESGLDIPSVNTLFVNRADDFGLADLHQLRGRIGRYKHRAHAYFILPEKRPVTPAAARRLKLIEDFAYLGAGFDIAMRDLEIRGAGNVLGREQHGHIVAVGYGMYCRLLETAVASMKGEKAERAEWVDLRIGLAAYIPSDYVSDTKQRLELYRRLAGAANGEEIDDVFRSMKDRFGPHPPEVETLEVESRLRAGLSALGALCVQRVGEFIELTLRERTRETVDKLLSAGWRQVRPEKFVLPVARMDPSDVLKALQKLI